MNRKIGMFRIAYFLVFIGGCTACQAEGDNPGTAYAPQMYHSVAYEPLSQIRDPQAGRWLSNREDGLGEFYNSNPYNPYAMNMRVPPQHTVRRTEDGTRPYRIAPQNIEEAETTLKNPYGKEVLVEGKALYTTFCSLCHGDQGQGDGLVGKEFKGVPAYNKGRTKTLNAGHVFHVITYGYGRMGAHSAQITPSERWKIVNYVQQLQQRED